MIRPFLFVLMMTSSACLAGEVQDRYASVVDDFLPSPMLDPNAAFADPDRALGPADGRTVALGVGSVLTLRFFRDVPDGHGPDLRVVEIGPDGARAWIAVSADGANFIEYPATLLDSVGNDVDLADVGLPSIAFVRLRGADDLGLDPGFDLDAIEALH